MINLTNISTTLDTLALVIPNQNQGYKPTLSNGQALKNQTPFLFHYEGLNQIDISSDITDHYVEDNTSMQDHAALRPERIQVHGFVGEMLVGSNNPIETATAVASRLPLVSGLSPQLSVSAMKAYNSASEAISQAEDVATSGLSVLNGLLGNGSQNYQQVAFNWFYSYFIARTLFTVETPWVVFDNMMIETMRAVQDETTRSMTDFFLTFKKVRFVDNEDPTIFYDGRLNAQSSSLKNFSTQKPVSVTDTISSLFGLG